MRDHGKTLAFAPRLPPALTRLRFRLRYRGRQLRVDLRADDARYELLDGEPLGIFHHGEPLIVGKDSPRTYPRPAVAATPPVAQPFGREAGGEGVGIEPEDTGMRAPRPLH
jgi:alpha,alpha-trehalose phosphorylase